MFCAYPENLKDLPKVLIFLRLACFVRNESEVVFQLTFLLVKYLCSMTTHLAVMFNLDTIIEDHGSKYNHSLINFAEGKT